MTKCRALITDIGGLKTLIWNFHFVDTNFLKNRGRFTHGFVDQRGYNEAVQSFSFDNNCDEFWNQCKHFKNEPQWWKDLYDYISHWFSSYVLLLQFNINRRIAENITATININSIVKLFFSLKKRRNTSLLWALTAML